MPTPALLRWIAPAFRMAVWLLPMLIAAAADQPGPPIANAAAEEASRAARGELVPTGTSVEVVPATSQPTLDDFPSSTPPPPAPLRSSRAAVGAWLDEVHREQQAHASAAILQQGKSAAAYIAEQRALAQPPFPWFAILLPCAIVCLWGFKLGLRWLAKERRTGRFIRAAGKRAIVVVSTRFYRRQEAGRRKP